MTRNPLSNLMYTIVVWTPILAVAAAIVWVFAVGLLNLETRTFGSELFVGNHETANVPEWKVGNSGGDGSMGGSEADMLADALNSGDTARMQAALVQHEMNQGS